ncbi:hypothetical protein Tco_1208084, partial [Tanacetum coccineum]
MVVSVDAFDVGWTFGEWGSGLRGGLGGAAVDVIVVVGSGDAEVNLDMMC